MKRVLFLAYLFPPILNSGTHRPLKFAKYLVQHGWAATVVTAADFEGHPTDWRLVDEIPADVTVVRVPMVNQRLAAGCRAVLGNAIGGRIGDGLSWRLRNRFQTPDLYALWQPAALRAGLKIFNESGFDAIYATGFPWTSLLTGTALAEATGRPLIADFRDPWAAEPLFREGHAAYEQELLLERRVLERAQAVTGCSEGLMRLMSSAHPHIDPDKFMAIHNGFDAADLGHGQPQRAGERFRIVYTGVWKDQYNPSELYDSIDWLRRAQPHVLSGVEVVAAGFPPGEARRRGLDAVIREVGVVAHADAVELMQSADLLYLSAAAPGRRWGIPGKVYEYLASGAPVVALAHEDSDTSRVIKTVGGGVAVSPDDPGVLYKFLGDACRTRQVTVPPRNPAALARFERRALAGQLASLLDYACSTARSTRADSTDSATRTSYAGSTSAQPATRVVS